ncbi:MAG: hypothetical protein ACTSWL_06820 [Promethearchaeota archaeon]
MNNIVEKSLLVEKETIHAIDFLKFRAENQFEEVSSLKMESSAELSSSFSSIGNTLRGIWKSYFSQFESISSILKSGFQTQIINRSINLASPPNTLAIGVQVLNNRKIERKFISQNIIPAISNQYWKKIIQNIILSERYSSVIQKLKKKNIHHIDKLIDEEIRKVPMELDDSIKIEFRKQYSIKPLSFEQFLLIKSPKNYDNNIELSSKNQEEESNKLRHDFEQALEKKKLEQLKEKQLDTFDNYKEYFDMDQRELDRIRRRNISKRKVSKQTRRRKYSK